MDSQRKILHLPIAPKMRLRKPPRRFDAEQRKAWHEIVAACTKYDLLRMDCFAVEMAACSLVNLRAGLLGKTSTKQLNSLLVGLGVT